MMRLKILDFFPMLVQRCSLDQHRLILPVSVTKPVFAGSGFQPGLDHGDYKALVDTGAQRSVVSRSVIQERQLVRTGHMLFAGLHGAQTHSRFLAAIGLWVRRVSVDSRSNDYDHAERSLFNLGAPVEVVDMNDNVNFDLILGFDVLKQISFNFDCGTQTFEAIVQG